jgi:hypothetical protein
MAVTVTTGVTKAELRRRVARRLRDWVGLVATGTSSGLSTFTDEDNLYAQAGSLVTAQVKIMTGHADNVGLIRRVASNIPGTLTFARDLPQPAAEGDTADLVNVSGRGYPFRTYDEVLAEVLDSTRSDFHIPISSTITPDFDGETPLITLPADFAIVYALEYADGYDTYGLGPARTRSAHAEGWFAEGDGVLRLEGRWRWAASGFPITVYGYGPHPAAPEDDDLIALDSEWFILACASRLGQMRTGDREWSQWAAQWTQEANGRRLAMATAYEPDSRQVR